MRRALALLLLAVACTGADGKVDSGVVGTWELMVPNAQGVARWVWDIRSNGTYDFHAEGPGDIPSHHGTFAAKGGQYTLRSTTSFVWADTGTYVLADVNTLSATGKLGTASWSRLGEKALAKGTVPDVPADGSPSSAIYAFLRTYPIMDSSLPEPLTAPHTEAASLDAQQKGDGAIGVVKTTVQGTSSHGPGVILFVVFRDRKAAEAAFAANADVNAPTFRNEPQVIVTSYTSSFEFKERGTARCLSRVRVMSPDASATCYLLVQRPRPEAVMIIGIINERKNGNNGEVSRRAIDEGGQLILGGITYWERNFPNILASIAKGAGNR